MRTEAVAERTGRMKPRALAALALLWLSTALGWSWPWGVLFLSMSFQTVRMGETSLLEPVSRAANPVVFYLIVATWVGLSLSLIAWDVVRAFAPGWLTYG